MRPATITVKNQFEGLHRWPDAPGHSMFLALEHRHVFVVRTTVAVEHHNRAVEFFQLKGDVENKLKTYTYHLGELSCEMIANQIMDHLFELRYDVVKVSVFEDDENGATVYRSDEDLQFEEEEND